MPVGPSRPVLGVALDGAGGHPAAWRSPGAADGLMSAERLVRLVQLAERGGFDIAFLDDGFDPPDVGSATLPARLDALLALARVAPVTTTIGLVATITTTHTEPFHNAKNIATLDLVSDGRAGWHVGVSASDAAAKSFGRTGPQPSADLWAEADDAIEVASRLWDSWEDDAVIRDVATGRYLDRAKVHHIDFQGRFFSVRGPSITPRSPQGQPIVVVTAGDEHATDVASRRADIVLIAAADVEAARRRRDDVVGRAVAVGRAADTLTVLATARIGSPAGRAELERLAGGSPPSSASSLDLVGGAEDVAATMGSWVASGAVDGFVLRPDVLPATLEWLVDDVLPLLGGPSDVARRTLRARLGLERPANRYAAAEVGP